MLGTYFQIQMRALRAAAGEGEGRRRARAHPQSLREGRVSFLLRDARPQRGLLDLRDDAEDGLVHSLLPF